MPKFIVSWDGGFGSSYEVEEHGSQDAAEMAAYQYWKDEAESQAQYSAQLATAVELLEMGEDPTDYGIEVTIEDCEAVGIDPAEYGFDED